MEILRCVNYPSHFTLHLHLHLHPSSFASFAFHPSSFILHFITFTLHPSLFTLLPFTQLVEWLCEAERRALAAADATQALKLGHVEVVKFLLPKGAKITNPAYIASKGKKTLTNPLSFFTFTSSSLHPSPFTLHPSPYTFHP